MIPNQPQPAPVTEEMRELVVNVYHDLRAIAKRLAVCLDNAPFLGHLVSLEATAALAAAKKAGLLP